MNISQTKAYRRILRLAGERGRQCRKTGLKPVYCGGVVRVCRRKA